MTSLTLSRITLKRDPSVDYLMKALAPRQGAGQTLATDHKLLWSLFPGPDADRDFLWRHDGDQDPYYVLSHRQPNAQSPIFDVASKPFEPALASGDRLAFSLRLNATVDRKDAKTGKSARHDLAMDALYGMPRGERAANRQEVAEKAATNWLSNRGPANGYSLKAARLEGYRPLDVPREDRPRRPARFGIFDLTGLLEVADPAQFIDRLGKGFGRARAFGCGLMLIRRAP